LASARVAAPAFVGSKEIPDEILIGRFHGGDERAVEILLGRYRNFARLKARSYFLVGADRDDIIQEGMIGLYKAIRDFSGSKQASFRAFAEVCITRQIITAIKTATRQKHGPLNSYVSLNKPVAPEEDPDRVLLDVLRGVASEDPAEMVISHEDLRNIKVAFSEILSDFEAEVLRLYVEGKTYSEISDLLRRHVKSIDNALQRIKRKIELHLRARAKRQRAEAAREDTITAFERR
jgi:RNA polymerase sporulation-specific sigma factor